MTVFNYRVVHDPTGAANVLTNIQNIQITRGRVQVQDPFKAGTATIQGRVLSSFPAVNIGDGVRVNEVDPTGASVRVQVFFGVVSDVRFTYGEVPAMDTWTIYLEDAIAVAGRNLTSPSAGFASGLTTYRAAEIIALGAGINLFDISPIPSRSRVSAQSVPNTNALSVIQQLIFTEQGRLIPSNTNRSLFWLSRGSIGLPSGDAFTDDTVATGLNKIYYTNVDLYSQADSYADQVVIEPAGLANQTAGTGQRVFNGASYDETTAQASDLAGYVLATLSVQNATPSTVSVISINNTGLRMLFAFNSAGFGYTYSLILRGVEQKVFIEGATLTATPEQTRITFNLVSAAAQSFFILDSASFGVLDQNKLGF